jgi:hypothetical protein
MRSSVGGWVERAGQGDRVAAVLGAGGVGAELAAARHRQLDDHGRDRRQQHQQQQPAQQQVVFR